MLSVRYWINTFQYLWGPSCHRSSVVESLLSTQVLGSVLGKHFDQEKHFWRCTCISCATGTKACCPLQAPYRAIAQAILMLAAHCANRHMIYHWEIDKAICPVISMASLSPPLRLKGYHQRHAKNIEAREMEVVVSYSWTWRNFALLGHGCDHLYKISVGPGLSAPYCGVGWGSMRIYVQIMGDVGGETCLPVR